MAAGELWYGALPAIATRWARALDRYHAALTGDPASVRAAAAGQVAAARRVAELNARFEAAGTPLADAWSGRAAEVFADSRTRVHDGLGSVDGLMVTAARELTRVADHLSDAQLGVERAMTWFGTEVRRGVQHYRSQLASAPVPPPTHAAAYYAALQEQAMVRLRAHVDETGRTAVVRARELQQELARRLGEAVAAFRRAQPSGLLPALARTFSTDLRSVTNHWVVDLTLDRSIRNALGVRRPDPWDLDPRIAVPPAALGSAGLGVPASTGFNVGVMGAAPAKAAVRAPGNLTNDLLYLGGLDPDNTLVYPFEDPFLNRLAATSAASGLGVGLDRALAWGGLNGPAYWESLRTGLPLATTLHRAGGYQLALENLAVTAKDPRRLVQLGQVPASYYEALRSTNGLGPLRLQATASSAATLLDDAAFAALPASSREAVARGLLSGSVGTAPVSVVAKPQWPAHSGLSPWTLAGVPFTVWGATAASDALVPPPQPTDLDNDQYYRHLAANSLAIGVGVGVPVALDTGSPKKAAIATAIVTAQNGLARFLFVPPPHPEDDVVWQIGGARPTVERGVQALDAADWVLRRGDDPGNGIPANVASVVTNTVAGTVAAGAEALSQRNLFRVVGEAVEDRSLRPLFLGDLDDFRNDYVDRSFARAGDAARDIGDSVSDWVGGVRDRLWVPETPGATPRR